MEMLQGVWKQHLRPRAVVGYGVKIFPPSPPNYVTRSPGIFNNVGSHAKSQPLLSTKLMKKHPKCKVRTFLPGALPFK